MRKTLPFLVIFLLLVGLLNSHAQGADNWIFGRNAGLRFNAGGNPIPFNGSALNTLEGCASFSDANGNLLFYSNGSTAWNRNHQIMPNGINLGGNNSSSQSALIVPNPVQNNIFYLFTVGAAGNTGFHINTVDMNTFGGLGSVISGPIDLSTPLEGNNSWSEKITAVKRTATNEYWVITFSRNTFYSFLITGTGLNTTPIVSSGFQSTNDARGYLKISPDGTKLVRASMTSGTSLYDFDVSTGIVSNEYRLQINGFAGYGVEFSPDSSKLYIGTGGYTNETERLYQFDMNSANINSTRLQIYTYFNSRGALQLASNGKIYWASNGSNFISVINNPNELGAACNFSFRTVSLGSNRSGQGLPPFIQSLFLQTGILIANLDLCEGQTYVLEPDTTNYPQTTTYTWYLNGVLIPVTTSSITIDQITNYGAGVYRLEVDFNDGSLPSIGETTVQYYAYPTLTTPVNVQLCDNDADGISTIDLTIYRDQIATGLNASNFTYYTNQNDAENETNAIVNPSSYNTSSTTIWVRVVTGGNCYAVAELVIEITASTVSFTRTYNECDDFLDINGNNNANNDNTDGISQFNFSDAANDIIALFPIAQQPNLSVHYYLTLANALAGINEITNTSNFRNITAPNYQRIYIRINNNLNNACAGSGDNLYLDLFVNPIPIANEVTTTRECDYNNDGFGSFDTSAIANNVLQGQPNITLTYFNEDGSQILPTLPNPFYTESQTITIVATNNNNAACNDQTTLEFIVDKMPYINQEVTIAPLCDDIPNDLDGLSDFDTSQIEATILGPNQTNMVVHYYNENGEALPSPLPNPFTTGTQTITVVVENPLNTVCQATTTIDFHVTLLPDFEINDDYLCVNFLPEPLVVSIENAQANYNYQWYDPNNLPIGTNTNELQIFEGGTYSVTATTQDGLGCETTKEFVITETEIRINKPKNLKECDTGFDTAIFNLQENIDQITSDTSLEISYFNSMLDLENNQNEIMNPESYSNISDPETIYVRVYNPLTECYESTSFLLKTENCPPMLPNGFTPNNDGQNDSFTIRGLHNIFTDYEIYIYNRYGHLVFSGNDKNEDWDGTYKGKDMPSGTYFYVLYFNDDETSFGSVRRWLYLTR